MLFFPLHREKKFITYYAIIINLSKEKLNKILIIIKIF